MSRTRNSIPTLLLVAVGAHGLVVQVVLLRELMAVFAGNELSAGVVLAVWIAAEALGAWLFGRVPSRLLEPWLQFLAPVSALSAVLAAPGVLLGTVALGVLPGESLGVPGLTVVAAMTVAVPALTHGGLFVLGTGLRAGAGNGRGDIGPGYVWEGVGTVLAALLVWFFFLPRMPSLALVAVAGIPLLLAAAVSGRPGPARMLLPVTASLLVAVALLAGPVERWTWRCHWSGQQVVALENSPYGKVTRLERSGQNLVLYNGVAVFSQPPSTPAFAEELAQLPLLVHPAPRRVLVLGSDIGILAPLLRHPVECVTVVQLDAILSRVIVAAADDTLRWVLSGSRVRLIHQDPRRFLAVSSDSFDCIIQTGTVPWSLAGNRLFSREFYQLCRDRLCAGGIFAIPGPGPATRTLPETEAILRLRERTLGAVFPRVRLVAADFPVFLASSESLVVSPESLSSRLVARGAESPLFDSGYVVSLLDPFRQQILSAALEPDSARPAVGPARTNRDLVPNELRLNMLRENRRTASWWGVLSARLYAAADRNRVVHLVGVTVLLLVFFLVGARRGGRHIARLAAVGSSGFAAAAVTTMGILAYQVRFGSVYSEVGLLLAGFMLGTVLGGWLGTVVARRGRGPDAVFLSAELGLVAAAGSIPMLARAGPQVAFLLVLFVAGAAVGIQFPIAGSAREFTGSGEHPTPVGRRAGLVTAIDLSGGCVGALVVALFLVPVFGIAVSTLAVIAVKLASAAGLLAARLGRKA